MFRCSNAASRSERASPFPTKKLPDKQQFVVLLSETDKHIILFRVEQSALFFFLLVCDTNRKPTTGVRLYGRKRKLGSHGRRNQAETSPAKPREQQKGICRGRAFLWIGRKTALHPGLSLRRSHQGASEESERDTDIFSIKKHCGIVQIKIFFWT